MYKMDIGVEIHTELSTKEKLFCGCRNSFQKQPNRNICPICTGLPGALPVVNKEAVIKAVRAGVALGGDIQTVSRFDRKNYFYVDNPKNYQITQFYEPIVRGGKLEFLCGDEIKSVGITQMHIEEDAGKLLHKDDGTYIDFNRAGVPLIEIVTEPHMHTKEECSAFLMDMRKVLLWNGISDCRMEEGSLRFDLNISIRKEGEPLGQRIEVKNINSFKSVERCIDHEYRRQSDVLKSGGSIDFETRRWDDDKMITVTLRKKEEAKDYRYIPDGDLMDVVITENQIEEWSKGITKQPVSRIMKLQKEYELSLYNSRIIGSEQRLYGFFMECAHNIDDHKGICNVLLGEISSVLKEYGMRIENSKLDGGKLSLILKMKGDGEINNNAVKDLIREIMIEGGEVSAIIERDGLLQKSDVKEIEHIIKEILDANEEKVQEYREGKIKLYGWFFGNIMKRLRGSGNPAVIKEILGEMLG